ncbi:MAG: PTS sugar transporter subunit IIB [Cetobacterium sp.]
MKILLVCSGGMSSAMVVKSLINEGKKEGIEITSKAVGTGDFESELKNGWDGALVAPQIRHKIEEFKAIGDENTTPVQVIETKGYSPLGGKFILAQVKEMLK